MKNIEKSDNVYIMGSKINIKRCLTIYEQIFEEPLPKKVHSPLEHKDHSELDESDFLIDKGMHFY